MQCVRQLLTVDLTTKWWVFHATQPRNMVIIWWNVKWTACGTHLWWRNTMRHSVLSQPSPPKKKNTKKPELGFDIHSSIHLGNKGFIEIPTRCILFIYLSALYISGYAHLQEFQMYFANHRCVYYFWCVIPLDRVLVGTPSHFRHSHLWFAKYIWSSWRWA